MAALLQTPWLHGSVVRALDDGKRPKPQVVQVIHVDPLEASNENEAHVGWTGIVSDAQYSIPVRSTLVAGSGLLLGHVLKVEASFFGFPDQREPERPLHLIIEKFEVITLSPHNTIGRPTPIISSADIRAKVDARVNPGKAATDDALLTEAVQMANEIIANPNLFIIDDAQRRQLKALQGHWANANPSSDARRVPTSGAPHVAAPAAVDSSDTDDEGTCARVERVVDVAPFRPLSLRRAPALDLPNIPGEVADGQEMVENGGRGLTAHDALPADEVRGPFPRQRFLESLVPDGSTLARKVLKRVTAQSREELSSQMAGPGTVAAGAIPVEGRAHSVALVPLAPAALPALECAPPRTSVQAGAVAARGWAPCSDVAPGAVLPVECATAPAVLDLVAPVPMEWAPCTEAVVEGAAPADDFGDAAHETRAKADQWSLSALRSSRWAISICASPMARRKTKRRRPLPTS